MRILLDHCAPAKLGLFLKGHGVATTARMGWDSLRNGELLLMAEEKFDLFITCDRNIRYQQNLAERKIAILELSIQSWPKMHLLTEQIIDAVNAMQPGEYRVLF